MPETVKRTIPVAVALIAITIFVLSLPETCMAQSFVRQCISFAEEWELVLVIATAFMIGTVLTSNMKDKPARTTTIVTITLFSALALFAKIAELGAEKGAGFLLVIGLLVMIIAFISFVTAGLGFRDASSGGAAPKGGPPQQGGEKKGLKLSSLKWIIMLILSGAAFILTAHYFGVVPGIIAAVAVFIGLWLMLGYLKFMMIFVVMLLIILAVIAGAAFLGWNKLPPDVRNLINPNGGVLGSAKTIKALYDKALSFFASGVPAETIGITQFPAIKKGDLAEAKRQAAQLIKIQNLPIIGTQAKNRLTKINNIFHILK